MQPIEIIYNTLDEDGYIRLDDFAKEISLVNDILKSLDRDVRSSDKASLYFRITRLRQESPATVCIEPKPIDENIDVSEEVSRCFVDSIGNLQSGKFPEKVSERTVQMFSDLGKSLKEENSDITIKSNGSEVVVKERLDKAVKKVLDSVVYFTEQGSISGIFEGMNLHGDKNKITIYPIAGIDKVICYIPDEVIPQLGGIKRKITVFGELKYRKNEFFPYEVNVSRIEVPPAKDKLPTLDDLWGIGKPLPNGMSSEDFINNLRADA